MKNKNKTQLIYYIVFLLFSTLPFQLWAQPKKIGYKALIDSIYFSKAKSIIFENIYFYNDLPDRGVEYFQSDYNTDNRLARIEGGIKNFLKAKTNQNHWQVDKDEIKFVNCTFDSDLRITHSTFKGQLAFNDCFFENESGDFVWSGIPGEVYGGGLLLDSISVKGELSIWLNEKSKKTQFLKLNHSQFENNSILIIPSYTTEIKKTSFKELLINSNEGGSIQIKNSTIDFLNLEVNNGKDFIIHETKIGNKKNKENYQRFSLQVSLLILNQNNFLSPVEIHMRDIKDRLWFVKNKYNQSPSLHIEQIPFASVVDLISVHNFNFDINEGYHASLAQLNNPDFEFDYDEYLRINKLLFDHYKLVGNKKMANLAYIKLKEIETTKLENTYQKNPNFDNFFAYQLNKLLKLYTLHGTNPSRALIVSFYIILIFAVFYFFFPSEWDLQSKSKLISNYKDFIEKNAKGYFKPFVLLTWNIFISFLNALTLSLNSFTTLGFGNIPTTGFARYICILQGFIGWFLLSLFTVALINQAQL